MNTLLTFRTAQTLFLVLSALFLWGCVTPVDRAPDWIAGVDGTDEDGYHIVAYGRATTASVAAGRAADDVTSQIAQILLILLDEQGFAYSTETEARLQEVAARRQELTEPQDEFRRSDGTGSVERYVLIFYGNREVETDLRMIRDALPLPVPPAGEAVTRQAPLGVLRQLLSEDVPETEVDRRAVLEEALMLASSVDATIRPGDQTVALGDTPDGFFEVSLQDRDSSSVYEGEGLLVRVIPPQVDGERETEAFELTTDENGSARFPVPSPRIAGAWSVTVEPLWLESRANRWGASLSSQDTLDLLEAVLDRIRGRSLMRVTSRAADIPTGIIVLDRDIAGNPIETGDTMRGMLQEFADSGFRIREVELTTAERRQLAAIENISVSDLYDVLPFDVLSRVDRVIVGDASIREFTEGDGFSVIVDVDASAFDLRRDRRLARVSFEERVSGSDSRAAIRAAFQASGRRLVRQIEPRLP